MKPARVNPTLFVAAAVLSFLATPSISVAGKLLLTNTSDKPITCTVDGYAKPVVVPPAVTLQLAPNFARQPQVLDFVECNKLRPRRMGVTPTGPNGILILNGMQTRMLNVLLYPFIPTQNYGDFSSLTEYVINTYQAQNPQVLLYVSMDPGIDIYDFPTLLNLVGPNGYDVLELDMSFLGFLVTNKLVAPVQIKGDAPWPVGLQAATYNGTLYGVPSWLCTNFIYYFLSNPAKRPTANELLSMRPTQYSRTLVSDFNGSWTLIGFYLEAYVATYGYANINKAFQTPPDPAVIQWMANIDSMCNGTDGNPCIDGRYHGAADGTIEKVFATGGAAFDIGFAERSFFITMYQTVPGTLIPIPYTHGTEQNVLMYADAFVTNAARCSSAPCTGDSQAFTTLMTSAAMKTYIAFSMDLPSNIPPRHLLVATQPFWQQPQVQSDPLYPYFIQAIVSSDYKVNPFPNWFTAAQQQGMSTTICSALKATQPNYKCTGSVPAPTSGKN